MAGELLGMTEMTDMFPNLEGEIMGAPLPGIIRIEMKRKCPPPPQLGSTIHQNFKIFRTLLAGKSDIDLRINLSYTQLKQGLIL